MTDEDNIRYIPQPAPTGSVPIPPVFDRPDFMERVDPAKSVEELAYYFMGHRKVDNKYVQIPDMKDLALTPLGAWMSSRFILAGSTINISMGNLTPDEVQKRRLNRVDEFNLMCIGNEKRFGIRSVGQVNFLMTHLTTNDMGVFSQGRGGSMQAVMSSGIIQQRTQYFPTDQGQKPSLLKRIFGQK